MRTQNEGSGNVTFAEGSIFKLQDGVLYDSENLIRVLDWQENVVVPEGTSTLVRMRLMLILRRPPTIWKL